MHRLLPLLALAFVYGCGTSGTPPRQVSIASKGGDPFFAYVENAEVLSQNPAITAAQFDDDPKNGKIVRFVAYLETNGIRLQYRESTRKWYVVAPTFGDYVVYVENIGACPDDKTLPEMQLACLSLNLAHGLNPKAKLIMSHPGLIRAVDDPAAANSPQESENQFNEIKLSAEYTALESRLKQLFIKYEK